MSRSALARQEGNVKERERVADELFEMVVENGRNNRTKNLLPLWGPDDSFHFNPMLLQNIRQSSYFQKCCQELTDWNKIVDEIYYQVDHLEPFAAGSKTQPSKAFCLLLRLLALRCTEKQMQLLLEHVDSPYIRGIGFLYLRYAGEPTHVWGWIQPYLHDDEPISVVANAKSAKKSTVGDFVRALFFGREHYGTMLPRFPLETERDIQVKILQAEKVAERAEEHIRDPKVMQHFRKLGSKVMALYGDAENPIRWYDAVVDRVLETDGHHPGQQKTSKYPRFVVTFPEYGNTETVALGEMAMPGSSPDEPTRTVPANSRCGVGEPDQTHGRGRDHNRRGGGGYGNGRDRHGRGNDLHDEVRRRERDAVTRGGGRDGYSQRRRDAHRNGPSQNQRSQPRSGAGHGGGRTEERKRTPEEQATIAAKKRKLMAKYG